MPRAGPTHFATCTIRQPLHYAKPGLRHSESILIWAEQVLRAAHRQLRPELAETGCPALGSVLHLSTSDPAQVPTRTLEEKKQANHTDVRIQPAALAP